MIICGLSSSAAITDTQRQSSERIPKGGRFDAISAITLHSLILLCLCRWFINDLWGKESSAQLLQASEKSVCCLCRVWRQCACVHWLSAAAASWVMVRGLQWALVNTVRGGSEIKEISNEKQRREKWTCWWTKCLNKWKYIWSSPDNFQVIYSAQRHSRKTAVWAPFNEYSLSSGCIATR